MDAVATTKEINSDRTTRCTRADSAPEVRSPPDSPTRSWGAGSVFLSGTACPGQRREAYGCLLERHSSRDGEGCAHGIAA